MIDLFCNGQQNCSTKQSVLYVNKKFANGPFWALQDTQKSADVLFLPNKKTVIDKTDVDFCSVLVFFNQFFELLQNLIKMKL